MSQLKYETFHNFNLLKEHKQLCHILVARSLGEMSSLSKLGSAEELLIWSIGSDNCEELFTFLAGMTVQLLKMFYLGTSDIQNKSSFPVCLWKLAKLTFKLCHLEVI